MVIAVSACLLGENVRYDGGNRKDSFITDELSRYASFIPFCPEAIAFGTPRPTIRVQKDEEYKIISNKDNSDLTQELLDCSCIELNKISTKPLGGIIFKARSPSCGLGTTPLYFKDGTIHGTTDGIFAKLCREKFPLLPMAEESGLEDKLVREDFIKHLFAYDAMEKLKSSKPAIKELIDFHNKNKFFVQEKDDTLFKELEKIVYKTLPFDDLLKHYEYIYKLAISQ